MLSCEFLDIQGFTGCPSRVFLSLPNKRIHHPSRSNEKPFNNLEVPYDERLLVCYVKQIFQVTSKETTAIGKSFTCSAANFGCVRSFTMSALFRSLCLVKIGRKNSFTNMQNIFFFFFSFRLFPFHIPVPKPTYLFTKLSHLITCHKTPLKYFKGHERLDIF